MIKDISSEEEPTNVPELEPEDAVIHAPKNPGQSVFSDIEERIENLQKKKSRSRKKIGEKTEVLKEELWKQLSC